MTSSEVDEMASVVPKVKQPYNRQEALDDIPAASYALHAFYSSQMVEAEAFIDENDPKKFKHHLIRG